MKQSVRQQVLTFAKSKTGEWFKPLDFTSLHPGIPPAQVHVVLSILKKRGVLKHNAAKKSYMLAGDEAKPTKEKLDPRRKNDIDTIDRLIEEQNVLFSRIREAKAEVLEMNEKYDDALAVIRYLEDKLIRTIQYTAQFENTETEWVEE